MIRATFVTAQCLSFFQVPVFDANSTAALQPPAPVHVHMHSQAHIHGYKYHSLTRIQNHLMSGFLSTESAESVEVVTPAVTAATTVPGAEAIPAADSASAMETSASDEVPLLVVKRDVADAAVQTEPIKLIQLCPGRVRFF